MASEQGRQGRAQVGVIEPIEPAIQRAGLVCFRPFELKRWFVIGFCAWLAQLGKGGFNFNFRGGGKPAYGGQAEQFTHQAREFVGENLVWVALGAAVAAAVFITVWLVVTWLSSRGRFMFLHCVVSNRAEVRRPWGRYRREGNSLFAFRVVVGLILFAAAAALGAVVVFFAVMLDRGGAANAAAIGGLVLGIAGLVAVGIAGWVVLRFTTDFVVPIMYLRQVRCTAAWREFLGLAAGYKAALLLYLLFRMAVALVIGAVIMMGACATCCCLAVLLGIPYIGSVIFLPVSVFLRSYSLFYLAQFGAGYNVFAIAAPEPLEPQIQGGPAFGPP